MDTDNTIVDFLVKINLDTGFPRINFWPATPANINTVSTDSLSRVDVPSLGQKWGPTSTCL